MKEANESVQYQNFLNPAINDFNQKDLSGRDARLWKEWKDLVNKVADEFDELYRMQNNRSNDWDDNKWQKLKNKAFKDL